MEHRSRSAKEPQIEVIGHVCREIRVHQHDLNFAEFDSLGTFLLVGSADHGKMFLCDTKTSSNLKLAPPPQRARKPTKFKPSFDSPSKKSDGKEEVSEADEETSEELQGQSWQNRFSNLAQRIFFCDKN